MLDSFIGLVSGSPWTYALVLGVAAGVLAGAGELSIGLVLAAAAAGAFVGDGTTYVVGRTLGDRAAARLLSGAKARRRLAQAERILASRGGYVIVVSRFIPGGRTVTMLTAVVTRMPSRTFVGFAALAAAIWASYADVLGYVGGRTFEEHPWQGLLVALGLAGAIGIGLELRRRYAGSKRRGLRATALARAA